MRVLTLIFFLSGFFVFAQNDQFIKLSKDSVIILVKDTSDYSKDYINELLNWDLSNTYILNRDSLIVSRGFEYGLFDTGLEKNKLYTFEGTNDSLQITLKVKRINYSTIEYQIEIKKHEKFEMISGIAHGGVSILGTESDEDEITGVSYFCSEYYSNWKYPNVILRIDSEDSNKAKVIISGDIVISLDSCPTLKLKE